ncbi:hypothetical protein Q664_46960 [Archangium violaceum Cb vi76]|uniref:DUF7151 domain-containing protein n=2 Tax=Archangium violaceum TaxID=83451 RepID=A0A084SGI2_9BACT|nr:hypothetical protein Q664_46960 [Archangium violaceum Cb vi76]
MWSLVAVLGLACGDVPRETVKSTPAVLVRVEEEAAGTACALGGRAIRRGTDRNGDGQLADAEVEAVDHVCRSEAPPPGEPVVLLTQTPEAPGANCTAGGVLVRAGADTNGNGVLEDAEVTRSFYGCQTEPEAPLAVRTRERNEPPGAHCAEGGVAIQAGADANRDGVLSDDEVESTSYVCGEPEHPVLTRTEAIAAGTECADGGSRVFAGRDDNANGFLEASEVEKTLTLCRARPDYWTYYGEYTIRNAADVVALARVGHIMGLLRIEASSAEQIDLPLLKTVRGLVIQNNPLLKRFSSGLEYVNGGVVVLDNPLLKYVDLAGGPIKGDVIITRNARLVSFSVSDLTDISGHVVVEDNASLTELWGLASVRHIGGNLTVKNNASLHHSGWASIGFSGPRSILGQLTVLQNPELAEFATQLAVMGGGITVQDNPKLEHFRVHGLTSLPGSLVLRGNPVLYWLQGLETLRLVQGDLHLEGFQFLDQLHLDALEHVGGSFRFIDNDAIYGLQYLEKLVSIGGWLVLTDNLLLSNPRFLTLRSANGVVLERNANLTYAGGLSDLRSLLWLEVNDNPKLSQLRGLSNLVTAYTVKVSGNPELASLDLSALSWVESLTLTNNTKLPTCLAMALRTQVAAHLFSTTISGNLEPSSCP